MERSYDYLDSDAEEAVADVDEFDDTEPVDYSDSSKLTQIEAGEGFTVFDIFDFLSPLTQIRIGFILEHYTDIEPRGAIIERDSNKKLSAVFNLYMEDFEDQEQAEEYLHVMQWYIPNHISVLLVPRSMDIELKPLVQNSDCEGEG